MNELKNNDFVVVDEKTPFDIKLDTSLRRRLDRNIARCEKCMAGNVDRSCPNFAKCPYVKKNTANTVINKFAAFDEIVCYKSNFYVGACEEVSDLDRSRKWLKDENGVLTPRDNARIEQLQKTITNGRKRALDNMYGYVLCNDWDYFVTITFKHGKNKKLSDSIVKYQWQKFRQQLQYRFPDIKIFLVPEDTPTGVKGMHFHGFMGNADLSEYLRPARNNKRYYKGKPNPRYGEFEYTKFGDPIFNFLPLFVNVGYTTIVKLKDCDQLKLVNYMTKYMHKNSSNFEYNENSYLHTNNLNFKDKLVINLSNEEKQNLLNDLSVVCYKETADMIVYRRFKNKN